MPDESVVTDFCPMNFFPFGGRGSAAPAPSWATRLRYWTLKLQLFVVLKPEASLATTLAVCVPAFSALAGVKERRSVEAL